MSITSSILDSALKEIINHSNFRKQKSLLQHQEKIKLYEELIEAIYSFPDEFPATIISKLGYPFFFFGDYQAALEILDIKIEDCKELVANYHFQKDEIQLGNLKYAKKRLEENRRLYEIAKQKFDLFKEDHWSKMILFASTRVLDLFVLFDVTITNAFCSGAHIHEDSILINKTKLLDRMRSEIHIDT